jgi:hypothetical protein
MGSLLQRLISACSPIAYRCWQPFQLLAWGEYIIRSPLPRRAQARFKLASSTPQALAFTDKAVVDGLDVD